MAFAVNMDAWRLGNQDVWRDQAQKNWEIENARAEAEAARRQQLFQDDQTDRQRRFANADTYGTGLTAPTTVEGSTARLLQNIGTGEGLGPEFAQYERGYQAPAVAQNPAVNNVTETPNAVTNNVTTGLGMQPPRTSGRGDPAPIAAGLRADLAAQGQRPQAELNSIGASDAIMLRKEIERTRAMLGNAKTDGQRAALQAALADQEKLFGMAQQGYAGAPSEFRANIPQAPEQMVQLAREEPQRQPVAQVQAGPQPIGLRAQPVSDTMGPRQPAEQRQMTVREDPRLAQIKLIGQEAMRKGDTATAAKMAEAYHGVRLESEMGAISSQVLQMTPAQINALASRMGDDVNTGLRGMLLESKFDPATGLATVSVGDKKINLSRTDMAQIASGLYAIERGATDAGYKAIAAVNKSIADLATQQNDLTVKMANSGNDARYKGETMRRQADVADAQIRNYDSQANKRNAPQVIQLQNKQTGEVAAFDLNSLPVDPSTGRMGIPEGFQPVRAKTDPQVKLQMASKLVADGVVPDINAAMLIVDRQYGEAPDPQAVAKGIAERLAAQKQDTTPAKGLVQPTTPKVPLSQQPMIQDKFMDWLMTPRGGPIYYQAPDDAPSIYGR